MKFHYLKINDLLLDESSEFCNNSEKRSKNPVYEFRMFRITGLFGSSVVGISGVPSRGSKPSRSRLAI